MSGPQSDLHHVEERQNVANAPARGLGRGALGWFGRHPKTSIALVLMLVVGVFLFFLDRSAEQECQRLITEIRVRGEPASVEDLARSRRQIPDEENLTIAIVAAGRELHVDRMSEAEKEQVPIVGIAAPTVATGELWNVARTTAARGFLDARANVLEELHKALSLRKGQLPVVWKSPVLDVVLPSLSEIRDVQKVLALEAYTNACLGEYERTRKNLRDMVPLRSCLEGGDSFLISSLIQMSLQAVQHDLTERCINLDSLNGPTLEYLQETLELTPVSGLRGAFLVERVAFIDSVSWLRARGATGMFAKLWDAYGDPPIPLAIWSSAPAISSWDMAVGIRYYNDLLAAIDLHNASSIKKVEQLSKRLDLLPWYCVVSRVMPMGFSRSVTIWVRHNGETRALAAAIAAERFRLVYGRWPVSLDDLVPKYLKSVPIDPFDDKPIRYAQVPQGIKTWIIDADGAPGDDGGDVRRLETNTRRGKDRGWVILNPAMRRREPGSTQPASAPAR